MKYTFKITVTTNEDYPVRFLMQAIRLAVKSLQLYKGLPCNRKAVKVTKVTVVRE